MIGTFQSQIQSRNEKNSGEFNKAKNAETFGSCKSYPSQNTQCGQEGGVQLMIKAHQMIRTLQEDNQILRMHVDLLTKDNKHLGQKLEKIQAQKKISLQTNENLLKKIQQLEIKLDGYNAKQQLHRIEKQNFMKNQNHSRNTSQLSTLTNDFGERKYKDDRFQEKIKSNNLQMGHQIGQRKLQIKNQKGYDRGYNGNFSMNAEKKFEYSQYQKNKNEPVIKKNEESLGKLNKNYSCYLDRNYESLGDSGILQRHKFHQSRNSLSKQSSNQNQRYSEDERLQRFRLQNHNINHGNLTGTFAYKNQSKNKRSQQEDFYILKNSHIRCNSPLIRKNSPLKENQSENGLQHHRSTCSSWNSTPLNESGVPKKFNYTSWRKTNNNLMVWRVASSNKPIMLNR